MFRGLIFMTQIEIAIFERRLSGLGLLSALVLSIDTTSMFLEINYNITLTLNMFFY